ncbi:MAG: hypothetical protein U5J64_03165 [Halobacteriales archaeon]|nr:hypothetical protein [Halobacteriales archaeon]
MASNRDMASCGREETIVEAIRSAGSLSELADTLGAETEYDAYFEAKRVWRENTDGWFDSSYDGDGVLPGDRVVVNGHDFHVHGVTHAGTEEERAFLREHASRFLDRNATIYCEQGIRRMYFDDFGAVCEMDDYRWSLEKARELDGSGSPSYDADEPDRLRSRLRESVFALVEAGAGVYGDRFADALGDVASDFLTDDTDASKRGDFESFRLTRKVAKNPEKLGELQTYYRRHLLPHPLEREWLRRYDPEIEIFTHARNERMAEYAVYHNENAEEVHLIVGAAHQPGVVYCLEGHRDGKRTTEGFELFG